MKKGLGFVTALALLTVSTGICASGQNCVHAATVYRQYQCSCGTPVGVYTCQGYGSGCNPLGPLIACGSCYVITALSCSAGNVVGNVQELSLRAAIDGPETFSSKQQTGSRCGGPDF